MLTLETVAMSNNIEILLAAARNEILDLRRQNEVLAAKVQVMDLFSLVLNTKPAYHEQAFVPDIAHTIQRELEGLEREKRRPTAGPAVFPGEEILRGNPISKPESI